MVRADMQNLAYLQVACLFAASLMYATIRLKISGNADLLKLQGKVLDALKFVLASYLLSRNTISGAGCLPQFQGRNT